MHALRGALLVLGAIVAASGLSLAPVPVAQAGGGCHATELTDARTAAIEMSGACFAPAVARIDVGETVTWTNHDPADHVVTGAAGRFGDGRMLRLGDTTAVRFEQAGIFPYYCPLHPSMVGAIVVGDGRPGAGDGAVTLAAAVSGNAAAPRAAATQPSSDGAAQRVGTVLPWLVAVLAVGAAGAFGGARLRRR